MTLSDLECHMKGTDIYPHMPILRPHATRYIANVFRFHKRHIVSVKFTSAHLYGNVYMRMGLARTLADFGLLGAFVHSLLRASLLWTPALRPLCQSNAPAKGEEGNW